VAERLAASQDGLGSMQLVNGTVSKLTNKLQSKYSSFREFLENFLEKLKLNILKTVTDRARGEFLFLSF
jgi:hypothetical protein